MRKTVNEAYGCTDVEGMFAVVVVVIAGVSVSAREPKSEIWVVRRRPRADELYLKSEPGRAEQRRKLKRDRHTTGRLVVQAAQKVRVVLTMGL